MGRKSVLAGFGLMISLIVRRTLGSVIEVSQRYWSSRTMFILAMLL